jgi:hypothetical protein
LILRYSVGEQQQMVSCVWCVSVDRLCVVCVSWVCCSFVFACCVYCVCECVVCVSEMGRSGQAMCMYDV